MERLHPFLTNPLANVPVTIFFYNDTQSQSRTVTSNDGGHFYIRTALEFVPTHVRVLALENLSRTEEIHVVDPHGVSLISDIDDTVKHTAIAEGAKEIFRNTFVRKPETLTVDGVSAWYSELVRMGVNVHYVSNSPWQLYPQLEMFFALAGLPGGSFHLKRYSGIQEFFEPTLEKKRAAMDMILRDFPQRRFVLVGDSGESDLEAYTELVQSYPGRVLGVFIRDVTTVPQMQAQRPGAQRQGSHDSSGRAERGRNGAAYGEANLNQSRARVPQRRNLEAPPLREVRTEPPTGDLIDLSLSDNDEAKPAKPTPSISSVPAQTQTQSQTQPPNTPTPPAKPRKPVPPALPSKPHNLRSAPSTPDFTKKPAPPPRIPTKSTTVSRGSGPDSTTGPPGAVDPRKAVIQTGFPPPPPPPASRRRGGSTPSGRPVDSSTLSSSGLAPQTVQARASYGNLSANSTASQFSRSGPAEKNSSSPPPPPLPRRRATSSDLADASAPRPPLPRRPVGASSASMSSQQSSRSQAPSQLQPSTSTSTLNPRLATSPPRISSSSSSSSTGTQPERPSQNGYTSNNAVTSQSQSQVPSKREEAWERRWERAQEILLRHGVLLAAWRTGKDVHEMCVALVEREYRGEGGR
ncbi:hypothetical protein KEM55_004790 [Ascosphaera atra]|nr:hypothetical protein KEM55_004790 [Ascosphaera atra]